MSREINPGPMFPPWWLLLITIMLLIFAVQDLSAGKYISVAAELFVIVILWFDPIHIERKKRKCATPAANVPPKTLSLQEFKDGGYLQEANRQLFHPLGLALSVAVDYNKTIANSTGQVLSFGPIWDYRDDPEGLLFGENVLEQSKLTKIRDEHWEKAEIRQERYGEVIQRK